MKYGELIQFEPITEIVKFHRTNEVDYQKDLIKTFVFSQAYKETLMPLMIKNLDFDRTEESFGLQVVGNYGTGKSHIMSLVSLIAENKDLLQYVGDENIKKEFEAIAGKFKVMRFELGSVESLWDIITVRLENYLSSIGVEYSFEGQEGMQFLERLQMMMAAFEEKYPNQGLMVVIDEMLAYLKGRSTPDKLGTDLQVLQALGQMCDGSKFKFIFGVQEMIYHSPEFQFAAEILQKVNDRYKDILITKEDVSFIVKNRLLKKNEHQKQQIREHLKSFLKFFSDMHARTEEYVELFPVHPSYFENFERIRIGKSQREILKTLSHQFKGILDQEVPADNPGLLTYDKYWEDMRSSSDLSAIPDVKKVKQRTDTIDAQIETHFTDARLNKVPVAKRIVNACAIKILQEDLNMQNGTTADRLVDDLCLTDSLAEDRDFLIDIIESAGQQIVRATTGQFFDRNPENGEFHIRIEGGVNYDQRIKDYASQMADSQKDEYFFEFLKDILPITENTYRTGFNIWKHHIEWKSHKTFRNGYIFFGNPNEKSTTHPRQHFYMYFMPLFEAKNKVRNQDEDEVYFSFDGLSEEFKEAVALFGAAVALEGSADSSQKSNYKQKVKELREKARILFDNEYFQITKVYYTDTETPLNGYQLPGQGSTKEEIFSSVASEVLESWFANETPYYPKFTQLNSPIAPENYNRMVNQAFNKIIRPEQPNRDGEGILAGLGLWEPGSLVYDKSPYAKSLMKMLEDKGDGKVLNKDEILEYILQSDNLWVSKDFRIEDHFEFVVMAALAALGEIEITLHSGKAINSTTLEELSQLESADYFSFSHIKKPKGVNLPLLRSVFLSLIGRDLSSHLKDPDTYVDLKLASEKLAKRAVTIQNRVQNGYIFKGVEIFTTREGSEFKQKLSAFAGLCDKLSNYNSEARIKNFNLPKDEVERVLSYKSDLEKIEKTLDALDSIGEELNYLAQAEQYITDRDLSTEVEDKMKEAADIVTGGDENKIKQYTDELAALKEKYTSWYLSEYLKHRISQNDDSKRTALLNSDEKAIADILKSADFLPVSEYNEWEESITKLKPADPAINKNRILETPYQGFNPHDFQGHSVLTLKELKEILEEIVETWENHMRESLDDPVVKGNINLLDEKEQKMLQHFKNNNPLTKQNAIEIRDALNKLQKGLIKLEISTDDFKRFLNKPMNPDESVEAFKEFIDAQSRGKERDKIRIIIK